MQSINLTKDNTASKEYLYSFLLLSTNILIVRFEKLLFAFTNIHEQNIKNLAHKIQWMTGSGEFEIDEIINQIWSQFETVICDLYSCELDRKNRKIVHLSSLNNQKINSFNSFKNIFWYLIKIKTLNYFNCLNNSQYTFENSLKNKGESFRNIINLRTHFNIETYDKGAKVSKDKTLIDEIQIQAAKDNIEKLNKKIKFLNETNQLLKSYAIS
ncbi:hypothetical protein H9M94_01860 [Mycoplasma sp. Pen4]|uniref:hypothetical protein n=1 Tax=Mycoplasma sp. Pen4 TaxID=640330 RepID=UPI0016543EF3|nr:hypothetical protein [Mycoplasma sp. Pen4]QNM93357.1 hypothetical protein H9M94_01860 [Mycoplasma sp. Pen4]